MSRKNKIILSTGALFHLPLSDIFLIAKKSGFEGLEMIIDNNPETINVTLLQQLTQRFRIPILSVHAPLDNCLVFGNEARKIINETLQIAKKIDADILVFHPWRGDNPKSYDDFTKTLKDTKNTKKIILLPENLPKTAGKKKNCNPVSLIKKFSDICLDTSHLATAGINFEKTINAVLRYIKHVHLSNSNLTKIKKGVCKDEHLPVGQGKLPLSWLANLLYDHSYRGYYCLELRPSVFQNKTASGIISDLKEILSSTKQTILK